MSIDKFKEFAEFLHLDENKAIEEHLWSITTREEFITSSVKLGQQNGYQFTRQEMEAWLDEIDKDKQEETENPDAKYTYPIKDMVEDMDKDPTPHMTKEGAIYQVRFF